MNTEILSACDHVLAAAVNGVYQGVLLSVLVGLGLRLAGPTNAATRHAVWFATLLLLACLIPAHILRDYFVPAGSAPAERIKPTPLSPMAIVQEEPMVAPSPSAISPSESAVARSQERGGGHAEPVTPLANPTFGVLISEIFVGPEVSERTFGSPGMANVTGHRELLRTEVRPLSASGTGAQAASASLVDSKGASKESLRSRVQKLLKPSTWSFAPKIPRLASLVVLALWLGAAIVKVSLLLWRLRQIKRLKTIAVPADEGLSALFQRLCQQLSVSRNVQLRASCTHRSPVLLGFVHPVVLLPPGHLTDGAETESILRHELAHVRRWDDWANLVQHLIQTMLFFHPAVWWISRQLSIQREIACDDFVLQQGCRPRAYALLLADLASRIRTQRPLLAPGVTTSKSQLQERINMILNTRRNTSPRLAKTRLGFITSAAALLAALAIYSAPRLVLAQAPAAPPATDNAPAVNAVPVSSAAPVALPAPPTPPGAEPAEAVAPTAPVPPSIEPGPKVKAQNWGDLPRGLNLAPTPMPAPPGVVVVRPRSTSAPEIVAVPRVAATPRPPKGRDAADADPSLEQRLRRLEKLVESLLEQKEPKRESNGFVFKDGAHQYVWTYDDNMKQHQEMAQREAARAADQAKRAAREAEKSMKLQPERETGKARDSFALQLEALQKQREALERQMEKLQEQIDRLQQEQEKLQEKQEHQSDLMDDQSMDADNMALLEAPCTDLTAAPAALAR